VSHSLESLPRTIHRYGLTNRDPTLYSPLLHLPWDHKRKRKSDGRPGSDRVKSKRKQSGSAPTTSTGEEKQSYPFNTEGYVRVILLDLPIISIYTPCCCATRVARADARDKNWLAFDKCCPLCMPCSYRYTVAEVDEYGVRTTPNDPVFRPVRADKVSLLPLSLLPLSPALLTHSSSLRSTSLERSCPGL
jgi:hypothetical protein